MKLYVLVRNDLSKSQQAVQAGHAVAEWVKSWWVEDESDWDNTLVYLRSTDIQADYDKFYKVDPIWIEPFFEPDLDDEMTAFAIPGDGDVPELLKNYRLV